MMGSNSMEVSLSGKTALVTGASSGIGAAVATALAANGATVWVNHPDEATAESAEAVVTSISESGGAAQTIQADVSSESDVLAMFSTLGSGPLDILVNNAGIAHSSPVETLEVEDFDRLMDVHLRGTFLCTRSALKIMYAQNSGRIINTASQLAYIGAPGFSHYTAAKGAILSFTRSLALEIGDRPITANCVAPGATMTPILADVPDDILEGIRQNIPAGRIAEVEDIVGAYLFLASDAAGHFRGQCLSPNGGDAFL
jgi:3-oxoacyl-[acyl-carrier protein] reductase